MRTDGADHAALREDVRRWLAQNVDPQWRARMTGATQQAFVSFQKSWFRNLAGAGFAVPHWPTQWGGGGRSLGEQAVIYEEFARAGAPRLTLQFVSLYHTAMTLLEWGSEAQKQRHLPAILNGELWCQGFSEPDAGSDLASLRTRAQREGERYIVNGQKIWSTLGQCADFCLLLARTDPQAPKHRGITFFLLDLKSKGVDIRPIKQITGDEEFCEIFLTDVEIPVENIVGSENGGWQVAQTTLAAERGLTILELSERMRVALDQTIAEAARADGAFEDDELRRAIVDVHIRLEVLRALVRKMMADAGAGRETPGAPSIVKLHYARVARQFTDLGVRLAGLEGQLLEPILLGGGYETGNWMCDYFDSYQYNIAGGSNEIQRNIVSERVLGMPREKSA
jgi:alkylation response protein AidB-like acyl-CoA dehydrogenase